MSKKILLIEDEPDHVMVVKARLEPLGYEVIEAFDGEEGFNKAKTERPDLIIMDVMLPGMNGFDVCRSMKDEPTIKGIPVLILTALGTKNMVEKSLEAGADDLLRKPWDEKDLIAKVATLLKK